LHDAVWRCVLGVVTHHRVCRNVALSLQRHTHTHTPWQRTANALAMWLGPRTAMHVGVAVGFRVGSDPLCSTLLLYSHVHRHVARGCPPTPLVRDMWRTAGCRCATWQVVRRSPPSVKVVLLSHARQVDTACAWNTLRSSYELCGCVCRGGLCG
jgi:hypothetical protein